MNKQSDNTVQGRGVMDGGKDGVGVKSLITTSIINKADISRPLSSYKHEEVISSFKIEFQDYRPPINGYELAEFLQNLKAK